MKTKLQSTQFPIKPTEVCTDTKVIVAGAIFDAAVRLQRQAKRITEAATFLWKNGSLSLDGKEVDLIASQKQEAATVLLTMVEDLGGRVYNLDSPFGPSANLTHIKGIES